MLKTAIKFMKFEKSKSIGILIGILISVFLIGQQLSTLGFLRRLMSATVSHSDPSVSDIWVVTEQTNNANSLKPLSVSLVNRIRSVSGVEETYAVVMGQATMKFENGQFAPVLLIGSQAPQMVMGPDPKMVLSGSLQGLTQKGAFTADLIDKKNFHHEIAPGMLVEINGKRAVIAALTKNIRGYGNSFMYSTMDNVRSFTQMPSDEVSAVIVKVQDRDSVETVCRRINTAFPGVKAWPREELQNRTERAILKESNMGVSFGSLIGFAVVSGFFIIGLTLYTSTFDRVKDYGTLKAIGADNRYISKLVLLQAFLYGVIGYALAMFLLFTMKFFMAKAGLILIITPGLMLALLLLTLFISVGGSFFAVMKLRHLEPASVFK